MWSDVFMRVVRVVSPSFRSVRLPVCLYARRRLSGGGRIPVIVIRLRAISIRRRPRSPGPFARKWMLDFYHDAIFPRDLKMRRDSEHLLNSLNDRQPAGNLP
ncbi:hypothetical protein BCEP4_90027 [Burkholderia cepacia]|nr:hypothetical protein BCEP4_90027 [Burkholderia cepacia]